MNNHLTDATLRRIRILILCLATTPCTIAQSSVSFDGRPKPGARISFSEELRFLTFRSDELDSPDAEIKRSSMQIIDFVLIVRESLDWGIIADMKIERVRGISDHFFGKGKYDSKKKPDSKSGRGRLLVHLLETALAGSTLRVEIEAGTLSISGGLDAVRRGLIQKLTKATDKSPRGLLEDEVKRIYGDAAMASRFERLFLPLPESSVKPGAEWADPGRPMTFQRRILPLKLVDGTRFKLDSVTGSNATITLSGNIDADPTMSKRYISRVASMLARARVKGSAIVSLRDGLPTERLREDEVVGRIKSPNPQFLTQKRWSRLKRK